MLKLSNITKQYTLGGNTIDALRGVDLEFRENEFVSILGPSGCGKTTTLNIIHPSRHTAVSIMIQTVHTQIAHRAVIVYRIPSLPHGGSTQFYLPDPSGIVLLQKQSVSFFFQTVLR